MKRLTIFCSSKNNLNPIYYNQTKELINLIVNGDFSKKYRPKNITHPNSGI